MFKKIIKVVVVILLVLLQVSFLNQLSLFGTVPNFILIVGLVLVLRGLFMDSLLVLILGGVLIDLFSPVKLGIFTISFLAIGCLIQFVFMKFLASSNQFFIFIAFFASFLFLGLVINLYTLTLPNWQNLIFALVNSIFGIIIYSIFKKVIVTREQIKIS